MQNFMTLDRCIHLLKNRDFLSLDDYCNEQQQAFEAGRISDVLLSTQVELQNLQRVDLLPIFLEWANSYPQSYMANALAAASLIGVAWEARQNESADRTADYRFEVMAHYLDQAIPLIDRAVALCGVPVMALTSGIQLQASGVIDLEQDYLAEARKLAAKSPLLCRQVMWALNPKWSGDHAALHQFYHEASAFPWSEDQAKLLASSYQLELADLERQHGDYDKALLLLRGAVELYPRTATHEALAEMLNICGMHREAEACYLKAIECGPVARTYFGLGCLRSSSLNDMVGAAQAFEQATRYGHGEAAARWAELHLNFCMADRSSNAALYDKIDFMLQEGMQQYSSTAWFYQAGRYLNGDGVEQDGTKAVPYWMEAAKLGCGISCKNLALSYWDGRKPLERDYDKAFFYMSHAVQYGDEEAYGHLGRMFYRGQGTAKNYQAALHYLRLGAEQNEHEAIADLVRALWYGHGAPNPPNLSSRRVEYIA